MKLELNQQASAKVADILDHLYTQHNLEELSAEDLLDALLDLGTDLIYSEEGTLLFGRSRLLDYCGRKITNNR